MSDENNVYAPPSSELVKPSSGEVELASRWARLGGALIDGVISIAIMFPAMMMTGYWEKAMANNVTGADTIVLAIFGLLLFVLLHGYLLANHGQTIGKRLIGTRIISLESREILPLWKVLMLRYLPISVAANIPVIGQFVALVDDLFVFRNDKRCIHDFIAGTIVVKANLSNKENQ